jgi:DNA-directed RNA polymerase subunit M/transcription elongation factor TFIIS
MKFCVKCDNMYYIKIDENNDCKLTYYCRNCGHVDETLVEEGVSVLTTQLKNSGQSFKHIVNQYTKLDPTLPRIHNIKCPNTACKTNNDDKIVPEIIYMRYDDDSMKYLYICVTCDALWKTDDNMS